jgi:hypothetical protein
MLVFKRAKEKDQVKGGTSPGSVSAFNSAEAYVTEELILVSLTHFVISLKPSK